MASFPASEPSRRLLVVLRGKSQLGVICRLDPRTSASAVSLDSRSARFNSSGGRGSSQSSTWSRRRPPRPEPSSHPARRIDDGGLEPDARHLEVADVLRLAQLASLGEAVAVELGHLLARVPGTHVQAVHVAADEVTDVALALERDDATWVKDGRARSKRHDAAGIDLPSFCRVQMPFGPRKSGMPTLVEMPAPVCTTAPPLALASATRSASASTLRSGSASASESSGSPSWPPRSSRQLRRSAYPSEPVMEGDEAGAARKWSGGQTLLVHTFGGHVRRTSDLGHFHRVQRDI